MAGHGAYDPLLLLQVIDLVDPLKHTPLEIAVREETPFIDQHKILGGSIFSKHLEPIDLRDLFSNGHLEFLELLRLRDGNFSLSIDRYGFQILRAHDSPPASAAGCAFPANDTGHSNSPLAGRADAGNLQPRRAQFLFDGPLALLRGHTPQMRGLSKFSLSIDNRQIDRLLGSAL